MKTIQQDAVQLRVHLQLHQGKTIPEVSEMSSNLPEALEVYRATWLILIETEISIEEIDVQQTGLGLTGPGNGRLTKLLEMLFR